MKPTIPVLKKDEKEERKEKKKHSDPKILIDYREKNSLVYSELINLGLKTEIKNLDVADYILNNTAIERKTVSDFINSMINKRLQRQLVGLQQYEKRLLLIEGIDEQELYSTNSFENPFENSFEDSSLKINKPKMHPNSIRGFLLSTILNYKVPIIFTKDAEDTANFMAVLLKQDPKENSLNAKKKSLNKKEQMQFIIEGFPGIGPKTAKKLLNNFGSIKKIITTPKEKLKEIIGKKAEIFSIVGENYI